MWLRFLPFLFLLLLSQASAMQQEPIDVPFESAGIVGSPIEVTGNITVQETVAGNEVSSLWLENVVARNISNKPILLLVGVLDAVGPRSDGGYELVIDRFFSERLIQPAERIPLPYGTGQRGECCISPLGEVNEPKASFHVEFVQFVDGSTFGNPATAKNQLASRQSTFHLLQELERLYSEQGEQKFIAGLGQASNASTAMVLIQRTQAHKGTVAAISQLRKMLALADKRKMIIGNKPTR